jgi:peptidoglycan/LPS O-acetylase OafA/YrhL
VLIGKLRGFAFPTLGLSRLAALDGVRGLAVLLVLLDHASDAGMQLAPGADLNRLGKYGVYLFFVLSAFLLTYQLSVRPPADLLDRNHWLNYALRRFLRIFPVYAAVLLAMWLMGKMRPEDIGQHLLLREGQGPYWSIPVEVKYYLVLPFIALAWFWAGRKSWLLGLGASVLAAAVCLGLFAAERWWSPREWVWLAPNLAPFLFGSVAAVIYGALCKRDAARAHLAPWLKAATWMVVGATLLRIPALYNLIFSPANELDKFAYDPFVCGALWSIFLLGLLCGGGLLVRIIEWPPLRFLGLISFSAYLWHRKFLSDVDDLPVPPPVRLLVFLAIVVAVSSASYLLFERPFSGLHWRPAQKRKMPEPAPSVSKSTS